MKNNEDCKSTPKTCPFCGSHELSECVEWDARSTDSTDSENTATVMEYQCRGSCGRSFWA